MFSKKFDMEDKYVKCEYSKLWGLKEDMVKKSLRQLMMTYNRYSVFTKIEDSPIYFSPIFAPEWDIKDVTGDKPKYFKVQERKEIEVKVE